MPDDNAGPADYDPYAYSEDNEEGEFDDYDTTIDGMSALTPEQQEELQADLDELEAVEYEDYEVNFLIIYCQLLNYSLIFLTKKLKKKTIYYLEALKRTMEFGANRIAKSLVDMTVLEPRNLVKKLHQQVMEEKKVLVIHPFLHLSHLKQSHWKMGEMRRKLIEMLHHQHTLQTWR